MDDKGSHSPQFNFIQHDQLLNFLNEQAQPKIGSNRSSFARGEQDYFKQSFGYDDNNMSQQIYQGYNNHYYDDQFQENAIALFHDVEVKQEQIDDEQIDKSQSYMEMEKVNNFQKSQSCLVPQTAYNIVTAEEINYKFKPEIKNLVLENKNLFNVNQAKSIYANKISTLFDENIVQKVAKSVSPTKSKSQKKYERKASNNQKESDDNSSELNDNLQLSVQSKHQDKLAKNRESARNSRKRKKIYVDLLETKVAELTEEVKQLREQCRQQQTLRVDKSENWNKLIENQNNLYDKLEQELSKDNGDMTFILDAIRERIDATNNLLQQLLETSMSKSTRFIIHSALNDYDLFGEQQCPWMEEVSAKIALSTDQKNKFQKLGQKIKSSYENVYQFTQQIQSNLQNLQKELAKIDQCFDYMRQVMDPYQISIWITQVYKNSFRREFNLEQIFDFLHKEDEDFQFVEEDCEFKDRADSLQGRKLLKN